MVSELAGCFVPKNTSVLVDIMNMQRNPKYYENPLEFIPARFDNNNRHPFSWLVFSAGPRNCIGNYLFNFMCSLLLIRISVCHYHQRSSKWPFICRYIHVIKMILFIVYNFNCFNDYTK